MNSLLKVPDGFPVGMKVEMIAHRSELMQECIGDVVIVTSTPRNPTRVASGLDIEGGYLGQEVEWPDGDRAFLAVSWLRPAR